MTTKSILAIHLVYPRNQIDVSIFLAIIIIDIFYPSGEPISLQSLRCSPFAVVHYSFRGHCLTFAATSVRE
jgi:hypothetical protein